MVRPPLGDCSIKIPDRRKEALLEISHKLHKVKSFCFESPIRLEADFLGFPYPFIVRRIAIVPGYRKDYLEFSVGDDEFGNPVTTSDLETKDLLTLAKRIHV